MYRIRFQILGFASFVMAFLLSLFTPGTWVNRAVAAAMCGVMGTCSPGVVANLLQGDRAVAADVPVLVADRSGEFDDGPSNLTPNPSVPAFPNDAGPNIIRPEFDNSGQEQLSKSKLAGIWSYSIYQNSSDSRPIQSTAIRITRNGGGYSVSSCDTSCPNLNFVQSNSTSGRIPGETTTETHGKVTVTSTIDRSGKAIWGNIVDETNQSFYFVMQAQESSISNSRVQVILASVSKLKEGGKVQPVQPTPGGQGTGTNPGGEGHGGPYEPPQPPKPKLPKKPENLTPRPVKQPGIGDNVNGVACVAATVQVLKEIGLPKLSQSVLPTVGTAVLAGGLLALGYAILASTPPGWVVAGALGIAVAIGMISNPAQAATQASCSSNRQQPVQSQEPPQPTEPATCRQLSPSDRHYPWFSDCCDQPDGSSLWTSKNPLHKPPGFKVCYLNTCSVFLKNQ
jgi:hypothetical protein